MVWILDTRYDDEDGWVFSFERQKKGGVTRQKVQCNASFYIFFVVISYNNNSYINL
jgi:hypothetical protein